MLPAVLVAAAAGFAVLPRETRVLAACAAGVPLLALVVARSSGSPETRHLIFLLPFLALAVGAGLARLGRVWAPLALAALVAAQIAWAWDRTPELFEWEPDVRQEARADAAAYLAATTGPRDVLLGYDPLFLQAWEQRSGLPADGAAARGRRSRARTTCSRSSARSATASGSSTRARRRTSSARSRSRAPPRGLLRRSRCATSAPSSSSALARRS